MTWPAFEELSSSPQFTIDRGGNSVTRQFKVAGDDLINFCQYLCDGDDASWTTHYHPADAVVLANCYLSSINAAPLADDEQHPTPKVIEDPTTTTNSFGFWRVTATYNLYPYNKVWPTTLTKPIHTSGTTLSCKIRGSVEYTTFTANLLAWSVNADGTGGADTANPPHKGVPGRILIPTADIVIEWDLVANPPISLWVTKVGRVNHAAFLGFAAETLLFETYDLDDSMKLSTVNPYRYRCTLSFKFKWVGHNKEFREDPPGWAYILTADGQPRYPLVDMSGLFQE